MGSRTIVLVPVGIPWMILVENDLVPFLLTCFNFDASMDKLSHTQ